MIRLLIAATLTLVSASALAADVGVSVSIGQPGFYGRLDIGSFPGPQLIYAEPVVIQPVPVGIVRRPIYLHVPPGHAKNWGKHCGKYSACGQPVYFVQDRWYNDVYVPRYHGRHGGDRHQVRDPHRHDRHDRHHHYDRHEHHHKHDKRGKGHKDRD